MNFQKQPLRPLFFLFLLMCLLSGLVGVVRVPANAAPLQAPPPPHVVISEFRFLGPQGGNDEFIELFNATGLPVPIGGWTINGSNSTGGGTTPARATIPSGTLLQPGQYYLVANTSTNGYSGTAAPDLTYTSGITDDGGVALLNGATIVDGVGLSLGSAYKEGTFLAPLSGSANQSYERKTVGNAGNCNDLDNNSADFVWNQTSSNPQNSSSPPLACIVVTNVTSPSSDVVPYIAGQTLDITITFNGNVNVTGTPALLLETGTIDRSATYISGSGLNTLTFRYTVVAGDSSGDLDYVATDSLSLNGGTITGAIGDANLILPNPGTAGSLGANKAIVIDNGVAPSIVSFQRQPPISTPTNADTLIFRVTFSETVINVDVGDFVATGTTGVPTTVNPVNGFAYDVTISGGDLANLNGIVGLDLSGTQNITDAALIPLPAGEPAIDEIYTLDNNVPTVTVNQATAQLDPASATPVNFTVVFSEPINVSSFTVADITETGSANFITWSISDTGDHMNFTLSATAVAQNGTLIPSIAANRVIDLAGNDNTASASTDNTVTFNDIVRPTVTVNQVPPQSDPTSTLPIRFEIVFSEPINTSVFTVADITQNGTATVITWSIVDSGDHKTFTLSATVVTGFGTLIPSIAANRVTDVAGNPNLASTSTDNTITYIMPTNTPPLPPPSLTPTALTAATSIVISEFRTIGPNQGNDEFIELYNPTALPVSIGGWMIRRSSSCGAAIASPIVIIPAAVTLASGQHYLIGGTKYSGTVIPDQANINLDIGDTSGLALFRADGVTIVDQVGLCASTTYREGTAITPPTAANLNRSFDRKSSLLGICVDSNNNAQDFIVRIPSDPQNFASTLTRCGNPTPTPTITQPPTTGPKPTRTRTPQPTALPPPPPLIAISEFVPRPGHDWNNDGVIDVGDEYIELINHGVIDVNLNGYILDDEANIGSTPYRLQSVTLKPGERMVFYGKETGLLLSDGGDGVRLNKPNGQLGDAYNYTVVKFPDQSYCRLPDNGGDLDSFTQNCFPTPGLKNSLSGSFVRPPTQQGGEPPACPISDILPIDFAWAECPSFGNIWSRFYWDAKGWLGEIAIPDIDSKWDVYVD